MPSDLTLRTYRNLEDLGELTVAWHELLADYPLATTFSTPEWLTSWWRSFAGKRELRVLGLFDSASRLVGLAPLSISRERLGPLLSLRIVSLMGDGSGDSDNLDFPVRPGFEREFAEHFFGYLKQEQHTWDICQFNTMPTDSPIANLIIESTRPEHLVLFNYHRECSYVPLPETWDEYQQLLSGEDRKNLERYTRRLQKRYATRIYRCTRPDELPLGLEALFRLHQLRWERDGEPGSFASIERRDFYKLLSGRLLERGLLEFWIIELNGVIAAAQFAFRFGNRVFQLQEGYDPELASDRVGFILRGEVLKQLILEGVKVYDFLGGTDPYKNRWGAQVGRYTDLHFAPRFGRGGALLQTVNSASKTKRWLRSRLPAGAWKLLHEINLARKSPPA